MLLRNLSLLAGSVGLAASASLRRVLRFGDNPSGIRMHIYVPDNVAPNPPIIAAVSTK
jgi:hypothetical protein